MLCIEGQIGGAVAVAESEKILVSGCTFEDNVAGLSFVLFLYYCPFVIPYLGQGGALAIFAQNVVITSSNFTRNSVEGGDGGAIVLFHCKNASLSQVN